MSYEFKPPVEVEPEVHLRMPEIDGNYFPHSVDLQQSFGQSQAETVSDRSDFNTAPKLTVGDSVGLSFADVQPLDEPVCLQMPEVTLTAPDSLWQPDVELETPELETAIALMPGTELGDRHQSHQQQIAAINERLEDNAKENNAKHELNKELHEAVTKVMKRENYQLLVQSTAARQEIVDRLEQLEPVLDSVKKELLHAGNKQSKAYVQLDFYRREIEREQSNYARYNQNADDRSTDIRDLDDEKQRRHQKLSEFRDPASPFTEQDYQLYIHDHAALGWTGARPAAANPTDPSSLSRLKYYATSYIEQVIFPALEKHRLELETQQAAANEAAAQTRQKLEQLRIEEASADEDHRVKKHVYDQLNTRLMQLEGEISQLVAMAAELPYPSEETMIEKVAEQIKAQREARRQREILGQTKHVTVKDADLALGGQAVSTFTVLPAVKGQKSGRNRAIEGQSGRQSGAEKPHRPSLLRWLGVRSTT